YEAAVEERWHELELPDSWESRLLRTRATAIVGKLAAYVATVDADVLTEQPFRLELGRAVLSGSIDRLHVSGVEAFVVDLETGTSAPTRAETAVNAQLAMYQLAVEEGRLGGAERSAGAALVQLGTDTKSPSVAEQPALRALVDAGAHADPGDVRTLAPRDRLDLAVAAMSAGAFEARTGS